MRILLTNDDGIHAPGLKVLEEIARTLSDDIWIVAPTEEQSGAGRSLTLSRPLRLRQFDTRRFAVSGTPTDAVMMALAELMPARPDLILSGVNRGANLGEDVMYSGTVAAAMEGALAGIPAIALSQRYADTGMGDDVSFDAARGWGERTLRPLLDSPWVPGTVININFPPVPANRVKGIDVVRQGMRDYGRARLEPRSDPRGFPYYWLSLGRIDHALVPGTDLAAVAEGYVTVTPLHLDLTHDASLQALGAAYR